MKEYVRIYRASSKYERVCYEYRKEPVPRTGNHRGYPRYWRKPRTTQERQASYLTEEETYYGIQVRGRRKAHTLANAYDDVVRSDYSERSWKKQRQTQYKVKR